MARLENISGKQAAKAFKKAGWYEVGQVGSHLIMSKQNIRVNLSIPQHKELSVGTLRALIRNAGLSIDGFLKLLLILAAPSSSTSPVPPRKDSAPATVGLQLNLMGYSVTASNAILTPFVEASVKPSFSKPMTFPFLSFIRMISSPVSSQTYSA
jgi:predicted RNA binding protein YcfA (HicA-like mRNA interferase family)